MVLGVHGGRGELARRLVEAEGNLGQEYATILNRPTAAWNAPEVREILATAILLLVQLFLLEHINRYTSQYERDLTAGSCLYNYQCFLKVSLSCF
jgi:hypothetical protein